MPKAYILIGLPGVGKSTWVEDHLYFNKELTYVVSSDNIIEDIATTYGKTYNQAFASLIEFADKTSFELFNKYVGVEANIIVDRTNLTKKGRKRFLDILKKNGYEIEAVVFEKPDDKEWTRRLNDRPGKSIPSEVLDRMEKSFQYPEIEEGFDRILEDA